MAAHPDYIIRYACDRAVGPPPIGSAAWASCSTRLERSSSSTSSSRFSTTRTSSCSPSGSPGGLRPDPHFVSLGARGQGWRSANVAQGSYGTNAEMAGTLHRCQWGVGASFINSSARSQQRVVAKKIRQGTRERDSCRNLGASLEASARRRDEHRADTRGAVSLHGSHSRRRREARPS